MQAAWHADVARHLRAAADFLSADRVNNARTEIGTAIGYLLRAAGNGDDDAFELLRTLRSAIEEAEPTQVLTLDPEET
jgi:hypothetical protein